MDRPDILWFPNSAGEAPSSVATAAAAVSYHTARTRADLTGAFELLQRRYQDAGLAQVDEKPMRVMPYHLTSASQVFVARTGSQVIGTVTLVRDCPENLPISGAYPAAMARLRAQSRMVGEVASLAIDASVMQAWKLSRGEVFGELTRLLTFFARSQGVECLTILVHPRHGKFYRHAMGFQVIGAETRCAAVDGQPGIPLLGSVIDATRYRPRWRRHYFDGEFAAEDLQPRPISDQDRRYFAATGCWSERKAA